MRRARGITAVILATGVAAAVLITALGAALHTGPVSQTESNLLSTVLGAAVGAVAVYLGGSEHRSSSASSPAVEDLDPPAGPEPPDAGDLDYP